MSKTSANITYYYNTPRLLVQRQYGFKKNIGFGDDIAVKLYKHLDAYICDIPAPDPVANQGGVFNLEYSLDGSLLVAACEERSVLIYDSLNQRLIKQIKSAHCNCVNCVRFLDATTFATCSDDNTIKLWDTRQLSSAKRTLNGHVNWVKNIEYSEKEKVMVTSAFDGSICAWDLNSPTENNLLFNKVFAMKGLMRTKLTPDGSKLIISTTCGYMIIIHDVNLMMLYNDMKGFSPHAYRLMQQDNQTFPAFTSFNKLFSPERRRNRLEFIDDFPNDAQVISSLQIHPMGWCALSRNVSDEETEEWTAVHDIQTRHPADYENAYVMRTVPTELDPESESSYSTAPQDIWLSYSFNDQPNEAPTQEQNPGSMLRLRSGLINPGFYRHHFTRYPEDHFKVIMNIPRQTHYVQEKNMGKGYIKEQCFSSDGRLICSPYDKGVRLLAFSDRVQELCYCVPEQPQELVTVAEMNDYHKDVVVCCKFSPSHCQMVTGCLGGEIVWYRPIL